MPDLNPKQFPVLREEFATETTDPMTDRPGQPSREVRFTSVDRDADRPVSFATYRKSGWEAGFNPEYIDKPISPEDAHTLDWTRGIDVPMFHFRPASIQSLGTHSDYRRSGEALKVINHAVDEMWRNGEVPEGQIPEISNALSPDSVGMYTSLTGSGMPDDADYWTTDRRRMDMYSNRLLSKSGDHRPGTMDDVEALGPLRRPDYSAEFAPEPSSTVEEKLEKVKAPKEKAPRRKKGPDLQMTLPGI